MPFLTVRFSFLPPLTDAPTRRSSGRPQRKVAQNVSYASGDELDEDSDFEPQGEELDEEVEEVEDEEVEEEEVEEEEVSSVMKKSSSSTEKSSSSAVKKSSSSTEKTLPCEKCPKKFSNAQTLRLHVQAEHEGVTYKCSFCTYVTSYPGDVLAHVKRMHKDKEKEFNAKMEAERLAKRLAADQVSNKQYRCSEEGCGKGFTTNSDLNRHLKNVHKKEVCIYKLISNRLLKHSNTDLKPLLKQPTASSSKTATCKTTTKKLAKPSASLQVDEQPTASSSKTTKKRTKPGSLEINEATRQLLIRIAGGEDLNDDEFEEAVEGFSKLNDDQKQKYFKGNLWPVVEPNRFRVAKKFKCHLERCRWSADTKEERIQHETEQHQTIRHHPRLVEVINETEGLTLEQLKPDLERYAKRYEQLFRKPLKLSFGEKTDNDTLYVFHDIPNTVLLPKRHRRERRVAQVDEDGRQAEINVLSNSGGAACFARAVSQFLDNGDESGHARLRAQVVDQLRTWPVHHEERLQTIPYPATDRQLNKFDEIDFDRTFETYVRRIAQADQWFGSNEIEALAEARQLHFTIFRPNAPPSQHGDSNHRNVNILFTPGENTDGHYELINSDLSSLVSPLASQASQRSTTGGDNQITTDQVLSSMSYAGVGPEYRPPEHFYDTIIGSAGAEFASKHHMIYDAIKSGHSISITRMRNLSRDLAMMLETILIITPELCNLTNGPVSNWRLRLLNDRDLFDRLLGLVLNHSIAQLQNGDYDFYGPADLDGCKLAAKNFQCINPREAGIQNGRLMLRMRSGVTPNFILDRQVPEVRLILIWFKILILNNLLV